MNNQENDFSASLCRNSVGEVATIDWMKIAVQLTAAAAASLLPLRSSFGQSCDCQPAVTHFQIAPSQFSYALPAGSYRDPFSGKVTSSIPRWTNSLVADAANSDPSVQKNADSNATTQIAQDSNSKTSKEGLGKDSTLDNPGTSQGFGSGTLGGGSIGGFSGGGGSSAGSAQGSFGGGGSRSGGFGGSGGGWTPGKSSSGGASADGGGGSNFSEEVLSRRPAESTKEDATTSTKSNTTTDSNGTTNKEFNSGSSSRPVPSVTSKVPAKNSVPPLPSPPIAPKDPPTPQDPPAPQDPESPEEDGGCLIQIDPPTPSIPDPTPPNPDDCPPDMNPLPPVGTGVGESPVVPEPGSLVLLLIGAGIGSASWIRRSRKDGRDADEAAAVTV